MGSVMQFFYPYCCGIESTPLDEVVKNKQILWLFESFSSLMSDTRVRRSLCKHNEIVEKLRSEILTALKPEIAVTVNHFDSIK